jgi:hypothetical protein
LLRSAEECDGKSANANQDSEGPCVEGKKYQVEQADKEADRCRRHARNSRGNALAIALTDHENGSDHRPRAAKEIAILEIAYMRVST